MAALKYFVVVVVLGQFVETTVGYALLSTPDEDTSLSEEVSSTSLSMEITDTTMEVDVTTLPDIDLWEMDELGYGSACLMKVYRLLKSYDFKLPIGYLHQRCRCLYVFCDMINRTLSQSQQDERNSVLKQYNTEKFMQNILEYAPIAAVYSATFLFGSIGNVIVLIVVIRYLPRENVTNIFMVNLAVADLMVCVFCVPVQIARYIYNYWTFGKVMCYLLTYLYYIMFVASICTLVAMAIERYIAICHPMKSQYLSVPSRAKKSVVIVWILSLALASPCIAQVGYVESSKNCYDVFRSIPGVWFARYKFFVLFLIPAIILLALYTKMAISLWKSIRSARAMQNKSANISPGGTKASDETSNRIQVIKMLFAVVVVFDLCWGPNLIYSFIEQSFLGSLNMTITDSKIYRNSLLCLTYVNSALNPILYAFLSRQFRKGLKKMGRSCCRRGPDVDEMSITSRKTTDSKMSSNNSLNGSFQSVAAIS